VLFSFDFGSLSLTEGQILSLLYLGLVPTGVGFWLWNKGAVLVESSTLAIMNNLKIPLGVLFSIFLFQEKINVMNFSIGTVIIVLSIIILDFYMKAKESK
jgi:drug/metabolite transporter (DMT)-like permease